MTDEELKSLQFKILEIVRYFDTFCKENNITYYLMGGSALGAMRHKGFIPWDDDLDVQMLSKDYQKFIKIVSKEVEKYNLFFQSEKTDPKYDGEITKLRDRRSTFLEISDKTVGEYHQGIMLDIFEMKTYDPKIWKYYTFISTIAKAKPHGGNGFVGNRIKEIIYYSKLDKLCQWILRRNELEKGFLGFYLQFNEKFKYENIFPLSEIEFEGHIFPCPGNADGYLKSLYGDTYMELPPEDQRRVHAKYINVDERCEYQKKLDRNNI